MVYSGNPKYYCSIRPEQTQNEVRTGRSLLLTKPHLSLVAHQMRTFGFTFLPFFFGTCTGIAGIFSSRLLESAMLLSFYYNSKSFIEHKTFSKNISFALPYH
jgi:hypothetical protein